VLFQGRVFPPPHPPSNRIEAAYRRRAASAAALVLKPVVTPIICAAVQSVSFPNGRCTKSPIFLVEMRNVQDILWIGLVLALLAATLGYARLCDEA